MWRRALSQYGRTTLSTTAGVQLPRGGPAPPRPPSTPAELHGMTRIWTTLRLGDADPAFTHRPYVDHTWDSVFEAPDLSESLRRLKDATSPHSRSDTPNANDAQDGSHHWIVVRLLRGNVRSTQDVLTAAHLVTHLRSQYPPRLQSCLILLAAFWAVRYRMPATLDALLHTFITLERPPPAMQYNVLLVTLSFGLGGRENNMRVQTLIEWGLANGHRLYSNTSLQLLKPRFATLAFALKLKAHMEARQMTLTRNHLQALLAIAIRSRNQALISEYTATLHGHVEDQIAASDSRMRGGDDLVADSSLDIERRDALPTAAISASSKAARDAESSGYSPEYLAARKARKIARRVETRAAMAAEDAERASGGAAHFARQELFREQRTRAQAARLAEYEEENVPREGDEPEDAGSAPHDVDAEENDSLKELYRAEKKAKKKERKAVMRAARTLSKATRAAERAARTVANSAWRAADGKMHPPPEMSSVIAAVQKTDGWRKSAQTLVRRFRKAAVALTPHDTLLMYTMVASTLMQKDKSKMALRIWKELRHVRRGRLDHVVLIVGIAALAQTRKPAQIFKHIEKIHAGSLKYSEKRHHIPESTTRALLPIDTLIISRFLLALGDMERVDAVFFLWDNMGFLYNVAPDTLAFNVMLRTARRSKRFTHTFSGAFARMGLARFLPNALWTPEDDIADPRQRLVARSTRILKTAPKQNGLWHGQPGYQLGLRIATHTILANSPQLLNVQSPVQALRNSASSIISSPLSELTAAMRTYTQSQEYVRPSRLLQWLGPPLPQFANPTIFPTDVTFREYIHLLASNDLSSDIALALAWMRELQVRPTQRTIAIALVYWREVASDAPLVEAMRGGDAWSPFGRLVRWLQQWVEEDRMPTDLEIGSAMQNIEAMRNYGVYHPELAPVDEEPQAIWPTKIRRSRPRTRRRPFPEELRTLVRPRSAYKRGKRYW